MAKKKRKLSAYNLHIKRQVKAGKSWGRSGSLEIEIFRDMNAAQKWLILGQ